MASVNKEIADTIIKHDGWYKDDPLRVTKVVTYNNMFDGGLTYAILYGHEDQNRYEKSPACNNVTTIWKASWNK